MVKVSQQELLQPAVQPQLSRQVWCQVINTTADPDQPLMRSNMFTLLAPVYTQLTWLEVQSENNSTCADPS